MGLAKHFVTARIYGQRVPNYVYRFFGERIPADNQLTPTERRYTPKKKMAKPSQDKTMDDILDELLG